MMTLKWNADGVKNAHMDARHELALPTAIARILIFCLLVVIGACKPSPTTATFIFPNGFHGLLLVSEDRTNGRMESIFDRKITIYVPPDGKVKLKNIQVFANWHRELAQYEDGSNIAIEAPTNNSTMCLHAITYIPNKGFYYFVGTWPECEVMERKNDVSEFPLATNAALKN